MADIDHPLQKLMGSSVWMSKLTKQLSETTYPSHSNHTTRFVVTHVYRLGPQTITRLAELENVSRQHMERSVTAGIEQEWVVLRPNPKRKNSQRVHLTPDGEVAAVMFLHEGGIILEHIAKAMGMEPMPTTKCPLPPGTMTRTCLDKCVRIAGCLGDAIKQNGWRNELGVLRSGFLEEARWH